MQWRRLFTVVEAGAEEEMEEEEEEAQRISAGDNTTIEDDARCARARLAQPYTLCFPPPPSHVPFHLSPFYLRRSMRTHVAEQPLCLVWPSPAALTLFSVPLLCGSFPRTVSSLWKRGYNGGNRTTNISLSLFLSGLSLSCECVCS